MQTHRTIVVAYLLAFAFLITGCGTPTIKLTETDRTKIRALCIIAEFDMDGYYLRRSENSEFSIELGTSDPRHPIRRAILESVTEIDPIRLSYVSEANDIWFDAGRTFAWKLSRLKDILEPLNIDGCLVVRSTTYYESLIESQAPVMVSQNLSGRIWRIADGQKVYQRYEHKTSDEKYRYFVEWTHQGGLATATLRFDRLAAILRESTLQHWRDWLSRDVMGK